MTMKFSLQRARKFGLIGSTLYLIQSIFIVFASLFFGDPQFFLIGLVIALPFPILGLIGSFMVKKRRKLAGWFMIIPSITAFIGLVVSLFSLSELVDIIISPHIILYAIIAVLLFIAGLNSLKAHK